MLPVLLLSAALAVDASFVSTPIAVDGHLDEPAWATAEPITDFVRFAPTEGGPPPGHTEVRILHDDTHLYVGVRIDQGRPVRYRWAPREDLNQDDQIGIFLDTFNDRRAGYVFYLNPLGVQQDLRINGDRWNFFWDGVLESTGHVTDEGWQLEVAIPFRSLKYPSTEGEQEWGLLLHRIDVHDLSQYSYPDIDRSIPFLRQTAPLRLRPAPAGSGLEIMPSVTAIQQASMPEGEDKPVWTGFDQPLQAFRPSLDLRFGITPNIGFTGAFNPDFSQVEHDETPIDLNERFAFFFEERRPFFLDGADLFEDLSGILYTRSIVEPVFGAKVGGKEGKVSVGVLQAVDRSPAPSIHEHSAPGFAPEDVQGALASNTVGRVAVDAFDGGHVGLTFADKRILTESGGSNDVVGLDFRSPLGPSWALLGDVVGSHTTDGVEDLTGGSAGFQIQRYPGHGFSGFAYANYSTPGLRTETGFRPQTGLFEPGGRLDYTFEPKFLDTLMVTPINFQVRHEHDGDGWIWSDVSFEAHEGPHGFGAGVGYNRTWEDDLAVAGPQVHGWYWARPTSWLEVNPEAQTSRVLDYARLAPAQLSGADLRVTLWPTRHVRLDTSVGKRWLAPEGADLEQSTRVRGKLGYQFTRTLGARAIGEFSGGTGLDDRVLGSLLLTWLLHPGTGVWIGYAETGTVGDHYTAQDRTVFAKISILARP